MKEAFSRQGARGRIGLGHRVLEGPAAALHLHGRRARTECVIRRDTLEELTTFGDGGRQPGQFFGVHSIAIGAAAFVLGLTRG